MTAVVAAAMMAVAVAAAKTTAAEVVAAKSTCGGVQVEYSARGRKTRNG